MCLAFLRPSVNWRKTERHLFHWFALLSGQWSVSTRMNCVLKKEFTQICRGIRSNHDWFLPLSGQLQSESNDDHGSSVYQVSGCYRVSSPSPVLIEHCCLRASGNKWNIMVKCRKVPSHWDEKTGKTSRWRNVTEVYPDARVVEKHNDIEVTIPTPCEDTEIAAFGISGNDDQKRMQMAIFGRKPTQGRDWNIRVYLIDDSTIAFKVTHIKLNRKKTSM